MKVLLFGLPISTHRRLKEESGDWQDAVPEPHKFSSIPTDTNLNTPYSVGELRDLKAAVGKGSTLRTTGSGLPATAASKAARQRGFSSGA